MIKLDANTFCDLSDSSSDSVNMDMWVTNDPPVMPTRKTTTMSYLTMSRMTMQKPFLDRGIPCRGNAMEPLRGAVVKAAFTNKFAEALQIAMS